MITKVRFIENKLNFTKIKKKKLLFYNDNVKRMKRQAADRDKITFLTKFLNVEYTKNS